MKRILLAIIVALCTFTVSAQDKIIKTDFSILLVRVQEIGEEYVLYKSFNNLEGPIFRINSENIGKVILENGEEIVFKQTPTSLTAEANVMYPNAGEMEWSRHGFTINGNAIPESEYINYIGSYNYNNTYIGAVKQRRAGIAMMISGGTVFLGGMVLYVLGMCYENEVLYYPGIFVSSIGGTTCSGGFVLFCIGKGRLNWIAEDYNEKAGKYSYTPTVRLTGCRNGYGLGIALNF